MNAADMEPDGSVFRAVCPVNCGVSVCTLVSAHRPPGARPPPHGPCSHNQNVSLLPLFPRGLTCPPLGTTGLDAW